MANNNIKEKTISSLFWLFMERIGAQLVSFIVSVVLARLLLPEEYGVISLVTIFITILNVFVSNSFSQALVQKKDSDELDFSSVFFFNLCFSVLLYLFLFFVAPLVSEFYEKEILTPVLRVLGLQLPIAGMKSVQYAYVSKKMQFRKFFLSTLCGILTSAIIGITMACNNCGVWALVGQSLSNIFIDFIVLSITIRWKPKLKISFQRLKVLISYGWKVLVSSLISTLYDDIRGLIIGKIYTTEDLAFYNRGKQFPYLIVNNVNSTISGVLFPVLSSQQDNKETVKNITQRSIKISSYIMIPLMTGLAIVATPMVQLLLTEKWLPCVPYVQILCFNAALMPIQTANGQAILALGKSDIYLRLEWIKKVTSLVIILLVSKISVMAIAVAGIFTAIFCSVVNAFPNKKLLNYSYKEQIKDILPYVLMSGAMAAIVYWIVYLPIPVVLQLIMQVVLGTAIYVALSIVFKIESFKYLKETIFGFLRKE